MIAAMTAGVVHFAGETRWNRLVVVPQACRAAFIDDADLLVKKAERRQVSPKLFCRLGLASRSSMGESGYFYMLPERRMAPKRSILHLEDLRLPCAGLLSTTCQGNSNSS